MTEEIDKRIAEAEEAQAKLVSDLEAAKKEVELLQAKKVLAQKTAEEQTAFLNLISPLTLQIASFVSYYLNNGGSKEMCFNNYFPFRYAGFENELFKDAIESLDRVVRREKTIDCNHKCANAVELFHFLLKLNEVTFGEMWEWYRVEMSSVSFCMILSSLDWHGNDWKAPTTPFNYNALTLLKQTAINDFRQLRVELLEFADKPGFCSASVMQEHFDRICEPSTQSLSDFSALTLLKEICRRNFTLPVREEGICIKMVMANECSIAFSLERLD